MPSETIQWFPGHMAKTRRMISENLKHVDVILEILDARIPYSSRNPEITRLTAGKPTILLLNKASLSDAAQNKVWQQYYTNENTVCLIIDCVNGEGMNRIAPAIRQLLAEKIQRYEAKGMSGKHLRRKWLQNLAHEVLVQCFVPCFKPSVQAFLRGRG